MQWIKPTSAAGAAGSSLSVWKPLPFGLAAIIVLLLYGATASPLLAQVEPEMTDAISSDTEPDTTVIPPPRGIFLPMIHSDGRQRCPTVSTNRYATLPVQGSLRDSNYNPSTDPDINLSIRSYIALPGQRSLVNISGPTDDDAPQLAGIFRPRRVPIFSAVQRVFDWDWSCAGGEGCRGQLITFPDFTAVSMDTVDGEALYAPSRSPNILPGGYIALVLYAEEEQIALTYTREDTPAVGYLIHMDNFCVDPNLLALYRSLDEAGRASLPGIKADDPLGRALTESLVVAVRDTGSFMDPRSAKDWWQETALRLLAAAATTVDP